MTSSLVGSEMCIRDRFKRPWTMEAKQRVAVDLPTLWRPIVQALHQVPAIAFPPLNPQGAQALGLCSGCGCGC
eukprot:6284351-Prorocentrum_lima.AAC.1